jgi:putative FmdB family regulatory protein
MPIYDYLCADCGLVFEELIQSKERPRCPACNGKRNKRQFSPPRSEQPAQAVSGEWESEEVADGNAHEPAAPVADTVVQPEPAGVALAEPQSQEIEMSEKVETPVAERVMEHDTQPSPATEPAAAPSMARREPMPAPSVTRADITMRREGPEIWDLEREFETRQVAHLSEIAEKSQRLVKLMARIESLEGLTDEIAQRERELGGMRQAVRALEERTHVLDDVMSEAEHLRARILEADAEAHQLEQRIEELERDNAREQAQLAQQVEERDRRLEEARAAQSLLEGELRDRDYRVEDANRKRDSIRTELDSRTAALFKRDEMIQAADQKLAALQELIRERDRRVSDADQRSATMRANLEAAQSKVQLRDTVVRELGGRGEQLEAQLAEVRAELEESARQNQELEEALSCADSELKKLRQTQVMLENLKPMLDSLELTLNADIDRAAPALPAKADGTLAPAND